jgi:hypothetical protein
MEALTVSEQLVHTEVTRVRNPLDARRYDQLGSNGVFEVSPSSLSFAGYQVKKTQVRKLQVRNVSGVPQRLSFLPTSTPFFKLRYNKRGLVAPGMGETVYVQFTPSEWRYYYDCMRLLCPNGNMNVPIHAYPVMNENERYLPSVLDLGKCPLGETLVKKVELECTVPVVFEFEFRFSEAHKDIQIEPMAGEILGNSRRSIEISYTPSDASTAVSEVELRLSEFDFQPLKTRIIASAFHKTSADTAIFAQSQIIKETPSARKPSITSRKILQQSKKEPPKPKKLPELLMTQAVELLEAATNSLDRTVTEQQFTTEFRALEEFDREKQFKMHRCIGDPRVTEEFEGSVRAAREQAHRDMLEKRRSEDCARTGPAVDTDFVVSEAHFAPPLVPTWNTYLNDEMALRQAPLTVFVKAATTVLTRLRASRRLAKLKARLLEFNVTNREDAKRFVRQDWKQAELKGIDKNSLPPFEFALEGSDLRILQFPEQFDSLIEELKQPVEVNPVMRFDDLSEFQELEAQDFELAAYPDFAVPVASHYLPPERDREYRRGAEEEYAVVLPKGDAFGQEIALGLSPAVSKPQAIDAVALVRPHASLRVFAPLQSYTETDPEDTLRLTLVSRPQYPHSTASVLAQDLGLSASFRPKREFQPLLSLPRMSQAYPSDVLSDSDSESESTFVLPASQLETYLATFEGDDEAVKKLTDLHNVGLRTREAYESTRLNQRLDAATTLPTRLSEANKLVKPANARVALN